MVGEASEAGPTQRLALTLTHVWIAVLGWVVLGGALVQGLQLAGLIAPFCVQPSEADGTYPICEPCSLRWEAFGVVGMGTCPNPLLPVLTIGLVAIPQVVVVFGGLLIYPVEELLQRVSVFLPAILLVTPLMGMLGWTGYADFAKRRRIGRGLHRALLICLALLAVNFTMMAGGAWPWVHR